MEKINGIHPDIEVCYISSETASLRFPIIVKEEAEQYLQQKANEQTSTSAQAFSNLIAAIAKNGAEEIYEDIKPHVADTFFSEFSMFYKNRDNQEFQGMIEAGIDVDISDLPQLQQPS